MNFRLVSDCDGEYIFKCNNYYIFYIDTRSQKISNERGQKRKNFPGRDTKGKLFHEGSKTKKYLFKVANIHFFEILEINYTRSILEIFSFALSCGCLSISMTFHYIIYVTRN